MYYDIAIRIIKLYNNKAANELVRHNFIAEIYF